MKAILVCSSGGHLAQLHRLQPWWSKHDRLWVTFRKVDSTSLLAGEKVVWAFHPTTRSITNLVRNLFLAWRTVSRYRPDVVVSNGAGVAVPFFLAARMLGTRTVYIEDLGRISTRALTSRLCYPISNLFVLQVEDQKAMYPRGRVAGRLV